MRKQKKIILGVAGSIAAYKSADILRGLQEKGFEVSVVMTKEAEQFITPLTLSSLSEEKAYTSMFHDGHEMPHIKLAQNADLVLIAPATANIIGKIACGIADDLLTCIVLATTAPVVIVPAMNVEMYRNKIVQENCARLKKFGFHFLQSRMSFCISSPFLLLSDHQTSEAACLAFHSSYDSQARSISTG